MALAGRREQTGREYMVVPSQKVEVKLENINIKKKSKAEVPLSEFFPDERHKFLQPKKKRPSCVDGEKMDSRVSISL